MKASLATDAVKLNKDLCRCVGYAALNVKQQGICTDYVLDYVKPPSKHYTGLGRLTLTLQSFKPLVRLWGQITDVWCACDRCLVCLWQVFGVPVTGICCACDRCLVCLWRLNAAHWVETKAVTFNTWYWFVGAKKKIFYLVLCVTVLK
jgi:hypothetical protein